MFSFVVIQTDHSCFSNVWNSWLYNWNEYDVIWTNIGIYKLAPRVNDYAKSVLENYHVFLSESSSVTTTTWKKYCIIWKTVAIFRRKRAVCGWILIWDENIVVIDTKTTYFVNKSDFQYKFIVVRGRNIDLFRHNCRSVLKNHRNLREKKISDSIRAEVHIW